MMSSKRKKLEAVSFWPGYVDALVNVVLNILFLVGLLAVGLVTINVEALGKSKQLKLAMSLQDIKDDILLLASLGTVQSTVTVLKPAISDAEARKQIEIENKKIEAELSKLKPSILIEVGSVATSKNLQTEQQELLLNKTIPQNHIAFEMRNSESALTRDQIEKLMGLTSIQSGEIIYLLATNYGKNIESKRSAFYKLQKFQSTLVDLGVSRDSIELKVINLTDDANHAGDAVYVWKGLNETKR